MIYAEWEIEQLIPADGWWAIYSNGDGEFFTERIVLWALQRRLDDNPDREQTIVGMGAEDNSFFVEVDSHNTFISYCHESRLVDTLYELRREYLESLTAKEPE